MNTHAAGPDLHRHVKAAFIIKGTTLEAWCRQQNLHSSNVRQALYGTWDGPKGQKMRARVIKAAGLNSKAAA